MSIAILDLRVDDQGICGFGKRTWKGKIREYGGGNQEIVICCFYFSFISARLVPLSFSHERGMFEDINLAMPVDSAR